MAGRFGFGGRGRRSGRRFWPGGYVVLFLFCSLLYCTLLCGYEKRRVEVMDWGGGFFMHGWLMV